jgi:hypothetical protein
MDRKQPAEAVRRPEHRSSTGREIAIRSSRSSGQPADFSDPRFGQRAPFEHRNVHMRPTKDLADRIGAGPWPATGAPPGTRTPNPRIKSPNPVMSSGFGLCQLVSFPQVGDEPLCRPMSAQAGYLPGHRAPMEHRDWRLVLDRQTGWESGGTVEAADFGSAGSVVTVTWSVAPVRSDRWVRAEEGSHSRSGGATRRWRREGQCDRVTRRRTGPAVRRG